jgi:hypothetical protein
MTDDGSGPPPFPPPPPHLPPETLRDADPLDWTFAPTTPQGDALTCAITAHAGASEGRGRKRGSAEAAAFRRAIGAILASALAAWSRGRPISQSRNASAFTGKPVGRRTALAALDALKASGLLHYQAGFRVERFPGAWHGWASRWWPSAALLVLAGRHGVHSGADTFRRVGIEAMAPDPETLGVVLKSLKGEAVPRSPLSASERAAAQQDLDELHARVAATVVAGCPRPSFRRTFIGGPRSHGRYYAPGGGAPPYWRLPSDERLRCLTFNHAPVAEVDIRASHLAILHGLTGEALPCGDPYAIPGVPREAVKAFITQSIGGGAPARQWSRKAASQAGKEGWPPLAVIRKAVLSRFPLLREPAAVVPEAFLPGVPRVRALPHYLSGIEADALTTAMRVLWSDHGALALPVFDSLIVPRTAAKAAADALRLGYLVYAGVEPEAKAAWWGDGRVVTAIL